MLSWASAPIFEQVAQLSVVERVFDARVRRARTSGWSP
jgi:hypothetical protein